MHPQGHWVGGQAMHRTQELGWGEHGAQQAKGEKTQAEDRQGDKEQAECHVHPGRGLTLLVFLKRFEMVPKHLPDSSSFPA